MFQVYINLATGVGMEEKREVAYAHKKVLQGPLKEDADELFYNSICNGLSTDIFFHGFEFDFDMTNINKQQLYDEKHSREICKVWRGGSGPTP